MTLSTRDSARRPEPVTTSCRIHGTKMDAPPPTRPNSAITPPIRTSLRPIDFTPIRLPGSSHEGHAMG
nr:hypothetical protein GCM10020063_089830 [Dactylosporangium thailandense]